jgi:hypothetical protein
MLFPCISFNSALLKTKKKPHLLFLTVLLDEALSHLTRAKSREYDRMLWLSSPLAGHPFASSVLTLTCDSDALVQPNPLWAAWAVRELHSSGSGSKILLLIVFLVSWFLGFLVAWFLGFLVAWLLGFLVSFFLLLPYSFLFVFNS